MFEEGPQTRTVSVNVTRGFDDDGNLIGPLDAGIAVDYKFVELEGPTAAVSGGDFSSSNGEIIFGPGETQKTIAFNINDDRFPEVAESFRIRLDSLNDTTRAVIESPYLADIVISANDFANGVITFEPVSDTSNEIPVKTINEDTFSTARFKVLRNEGTFGEVSVLWDVVRADRRPEPSLQDIGPNNGTLTFADGENEKEIELTVVQDGDPEPAEQFDVRLLYAGGEAVVRGITVAKLTIQDSDNVYGRVEFGPDTNHRIVAVSNTASFVLCVPVCLTTCLSESVSQCLTVHMFLVIPSDGRIIE